VGAEHPLFLLYTSGSTGKPKGVQHSTGGYLLHAALTTKLTFDLKADDVFWCTADIGWVTGHTYITYGPLALGGTEIVFEGVPTYPDAGRFWKMIQDHKVSIFYTAPTAIRSLIKAAEANDAVHPKSYNLSSLRILGSVGEPINPAAWEWYYKHVGGSRCPIVDTFWQTETGGHMITPLPGATPMVPGSCTLPFPGIMAAIVDETGGRYVHVLADGDIYTSGDLAKAIACGADAVVLGTPLAVAAESLGGGWYWPSAAAHPSLPRGGLLEVALGQRPSLDQVLNGPSDDPFGSLNLVGGLRRSMAKAGYCDLKEFQKVGLTVGS
jgi:acyl-coenzyme A synthetase/AMP-(fatty) acid ligase